MSEKQNRVMAAMGKRIEELEAALEMLLKACEAGWHPMKINGAEIFTAHSALRKATEKETGE